MDSSSSSDGGEPGLRLRILERLRADDTPRRLRVVFLKAFETTLVEPMVVSRNEKRRLRSEVAVVIPDDLLRALDS